jgi:hypothetical protein
MAIRCPFCNFETTTPWHGKVFDCLGECHTTYTLVKPDDDLKRIKMRLCEIFFLDGEFNPLVNPDQLDENCEFKSIHAECGGDYILFAREFRVSTDDIENLRCLAQDALDRESASSTARSTGDSKNFFGDTLDRLDSALERFKRDLRAGIDKSRLYSEIRVVEKLVSLIREQFEKPD